MSDNPTARRKKKKFDCSTCQDKGFVRDKKDNVSPCPKCNPDGVSLGEADCDCY